MKQKDTLLLSITTFILVLAWIGFTVYDKLVTSTIGDTLSVQIKPIQPVFDNTAINALKKRQQINPVASITTTTPSSPSANLPLQTKNASQTPSFQNPSASSAGVSRF